jgi:hypothetical protein
VTSRYVVDRTGWPKGPWEGEPDLETWSTEAGLPAATVRHDRYGHWCGYVAVPRGHPLFGAGRSYGDLRAQSLRVHGGVTFGGPELSLVASKDEAWWLGFDCMHGGRDLSPGLEVLINPVLATIRTDRPLGTYRTLAYVRAACESLARQLVDLANEVERKAATQGGGSC